MRTGFFSRLLQCLLLSAFLYAVIPVHRAVAAGQCQVSLNGVNIGATSVDVGGQGGSDQGSSLYNIKVCGDLSQAVGKKLRAAVSYNITLFWSPFINFDLNPVTTVSSNSCTEGQIKINIGEGQKANAKININIENGPDICDTSWARLLPATSTDPGWSSALTEMCSSFGVTPTTNISTNSNLAFSLSFPPAMSKNIRDGSAFDPSGVSEKYYLSIKNNGTEILFREFNLFTGVTQAQMSISAGTDLKGETGNYTATVSRYRNQSTQDNFCGNAVIFTVGTPAKPGSAGSGEIDKATFDLCKQATGDKEQAECQKCLGKITIPGKEGLWTAVGCIPTDTQGIVESLLRIGLGLSGGFVILTILAAAFMFATSSGDPKKVQEAQEMVSAAIIGLLFVIFSVIILTFIGVSVLRIPGFGTS